MSPIARLRGVVEESGADWLLVLVGGVGLRVQVPASTAEALGRTGDSVSLHTYLYVREGTLALYGFGSADDLAAFELLLGVGGIGPRGALTLLSALGADGLSEAVSTGDVPRLQQVPGIGQKTAGRLVLELKGKLVSAAAAAVPVPSTRDDEVVAALVGLGYSQAEAQTAAGSVPSDTGAGVEERIRLALAYFGRGS